VLVRELQERYLAEGRGKIAVRRRLSGGYTVGYKCKAITLQAWTVPEGSRRKRHPDFKTIST